MPRAKKDSARENRISMDVVVDAYDPEERAMGWYYYIAETLQFPFLATCKSRRQISPLKVDEAVEVIDMADVDECEREMFVVIRWCDDTLAVPLSQLEPGELDDDDTVQAVEDWLYWVAMGYQF